MIFYQSIEAPPYFIGNHYRQMLIQAGRDDILAVRRVIKTL
jgi:hypothetical protein